MSPLNASDHMAIQAILARVAHAVDSGRATDLRDCYTPHAQLVVRGLAVAGQHAGVHNGVDAIVEMTSGLYSNTQGHCRHWNGIPTIQVDGEKAHVESYFIVVRTGQVPQAGIILTGLYIDEFIKQGERWLIDSRTCSIDPQPQDGDRSTDVLVVARDAVVSARG